LLEGIEVTVDPLPTAGGRGEASGRHERRGPAVVDLACGTSVRCGPDRVTVVPAPRPLRVVPIATGVRIRVTYQGAIDLFDQLDRPLMAPIVPGDSLHACFQELLDEIAVARPGRYVMVAALARRLLILLLRRCLDGDGDLPTWLAALEDSRLFRAVGAMRDRPEHVFTVTELAELAGMSRTVFAARFTSAMARPPIEFLKGLRFARAAHLLARTDLPVKAIASRVGYASRSSFTRAFVAHHGAPPTDFRATAADR
jgi:AraC-like DNA-binding protein